MGFPQKSRFLFKDGWKGHPEAVAAEPKGKGKGRKATQSQSQIQGVRPLLGKVLQHGRGERVQ